MTPSQILQKYIRLQKDIMFDEIIEIPSGVIAFSKTDPSTIWNQAIVKNKLSAEEILQIENILKQKNRKPTIYFELNDENTFAKDLENLGYEKSNEEDWKVYISKEIDKSKFENVKKVETEEDLEIYLKTFDNCYQENDPQNPYGTLGEYLQVTKEVWHKLHSTNRIEYFIAFDNGKPVAVSTLTNFEDIGYISNVGSLQEVRGKGFGKAVTLYCVAEARKKGAKEIFLTTEEGHYPNEFYKRIGFETKFKGICYTK